ncbi:hypothetical protein QWY82_07180 [Simiduia curdlanivorans]|uniref:Uncharacterized protein n=1 Tax=Simiduia curdlanivorans TaxID=1492769 RepID=A0ABV8V7W6_9GAMM|nr:hypothetical protein [Simiduia curdlanivorans]MDN3638584.1 hypothetical protein [Simiduia curdlanivorans]
MKLLAQGLLFFTWLCSSTLMAQEPEQTLDMKRLWLPKSYSQYWANLRQVAEYQLAQERCAEVIRAELDRGQSSLEAPVFAVICRDANRRTFVEKFDGVSLVSLAPVADEAPEAVLEEVAVDLQPVIYQRCQELWRTDVALMAGLQWLDDIENPAVTERSEVDTDDNPETTTTVTQFTFVRRFNANDAAGNELKYLASCTGNSLETTLTEVSIRRD